MSVTGGALPPKCINMHEWQKIDYNTNRMAVPGGWIYTVAGKGTHSMVFVPFPKINKVIDQLQQDY
jgi:hypothetical protein